MRHVGVVTALIGLAACEFDSAADRGSRARSTVRDSAGIVIVESRAPVWTDEEQWSVGQDPLFVLRAFDDSDQNRLLDPTSIDVDARGRIIVGDGNQVGWDAVLVYDSAGKFLFQAGRSGRGPGEFGQLWWASAYRGDSIVAFDMSGDQLSIFSPEGRFVRSLRTPNLTVPRPPEGTYGYTAGADAAFGDGDFLAYPSGLLDIEKGPGPAWYKHLLLKLSATGEAWDTLGTFEISQQFWTGTRQDQYWFAPIAVAAVGHDVLYFGRGDSFQVEVYDAGGRMTRIVRRSHQPRAVTDELRNQLKTWYLDRAKSSPRMNDQMLERMRQSVEAAPFAETLPPYSAMLLDPTGHLWVEEFRWIVHDERQPIAGPTHWSVFDPEGVWLGNVEMPADFILRKVAEHRVYGFVIDEVGVKEVYAHSLDRRSARR